MLESAELAGSDGRFASPPSVRTEGTGGRRGESGLATSVSVSFRKVRGMSERRFRRIPGEGRAVRIVDGARTVVDETQPGG